MGAKSIELTDERKKHLYQKCKTCKDMYPIEEFDRYPTERNHMSYNCNKCGFYNTKK